MTTRTTIVWKWRYKCPAQKSTLWRFPLCPCAGKLLKFGRELCQVIRIMQQAGSYHPPFPPGDPRESEQEARRAPDYGWVPGLSLSLIADIEEEDFCNRDGGESGVCGGSGDMSEAVDDVSFQSYEEDKSEDE
jgi:hypothetical protein